MYVTFITDNNLFFNVKQEKTTHLT